MKTFLLLFLAFYACAADVNQSVMIVGNDGSIAAMRNGSGQCTVLP